MSKRKVTSKYLEATAWIWDTYYEDVANRWLDIRSLYKLFIYGGR